MTNERRISAFVAQRGRVLDVIRQIDAGWRFEEACGFETLRDVTEERLGESTAEAATLDLLIQDLRGRSTP